MSNKLKLWIYTTLTLMVILGISIISYAQHEQGWSFGDVQNKGIAFFRLGGNWEFANATTGNLIMAISDNTTYGNVTINGILSVASSLFVTQLNSTMTSVTITGGIFSSATGTNSYYTTVFVGGGVLSSVTGTNSYYTTAYVAGGVLSSITGTFAGYTSYGNWLGGGATQLITPTYYDLITSQTYTNGAGLQIAFTAPFTKTPQLFVTVVPPATWTWNATTNFQPNITGLSATTAAIKCTLQTATSAFSGYISFGEVTTLGCTLNVLAVGQ